jgi:glucose-1-phosphate thymidylyltransferase
VKQVDSPEAYGVVQLNEAKEIIELVEKPAEFVSDLAVIGIYYFKEVSQLRSELQKVLDNNIIHGGEYQINDGIKGMMSNGNVFKTGQVQQWMDCGNKKVTVETNAQVLKNEAKKGKQLIPESCTIDNSVVIKPCYIGEGVKITNSVVGPYASIGANTSVSDSRIQNSIIQHDTSILNANMKDSMIGSNVKYNGLARDLSLGDYSTLDD